ncbi:MAG: Unknown protein [uncultured Campylobacterales bacterium]|uniref:DUF7683 domain-containing protein n=1 Tax=uncultured Campylobacterales bacterium TaxID=352960 RepID=A0A6S6SD53_9BACT|nr:MAG: Unknown protein [uncultured Campylobacterales bacterium]
MIERSIEIFYKDEQKYEDLIKSKVVLPCVSTNILFKCFKIDDNKDPCIYYDYKITVDQILEFKKYIDIYEYFLSCSSI